MIKKQIDPELLIALEQNFDMNIWNDLPATRMKSREMTEELLKGIQLKEHIPFADRIIPGLDQDPDVRIRVYQPTNLTGPLPALLWIHGGGYVFGSIDAEPTIMQNIAEKVGCVIVAVEYRLAPEHPFPAALNDCYAALKWLFENTDTLNVNLTKVAVGGISAGAGLTAGLALMARDHGEFNLAYQLLLCPMLDDRNEQPSTNFPLSGMAWNRDHNRKGWDAYLGGKAPDEISCHAVPARSDDLSNLPPAYISVGSLDIFLDENILYARSLMEAGVATELHVFPGATHGFEFFVPGARVSKRAHYLIYDILKHAFSGNTICIN